MPTLNRRPPDRLTSLGSVAAALPARAAVRLVGITGSTGDLRPLIAWTDGVDPITDLDELIDIILATRPHGAWVPALPREIGLYEDDRLVAFAGPPLPADMVEVFLVTGSTRMSRAHWSEAHKKGRGS